MKEDESVALERTEQRAVTENDRSMQTLPVEAIEASFKAYQHIQVTLDRLMPDQIMEVQGRKFRKKSYWRAIKRWASLETDIASEERIEQKTPLGGGLVYPDWGYRVTVRVTAPNGLTEIGDGSCMASEKIVFEKDWNARRSGGGAPIRRDNSGRPMVDDVATAKNATVHNIRSHAVTRAKNRAIADLVGFGEVSAEELPDAAASSDSSNDKGRQERQKETQAKADKQKVSSWYSDLWKHAMKNGMNGDEWGSMVKQVGIQAYETATDDQRKEMNDFVATWIAEFEASQQEAEAKQEGSEKKVFIKDETESGP